MEKRKKKIKGMRKSFFGVEEGCLCDHWSGARCACAPMKCERRNVCDVLSLGGGAIIYGC